MKKVGFSEVAAKSMAGMTQAMLEDLETPVNARKGKRRLKATFSGW